MNNRDRILAICNRHNLIPQATVELAEEIIAIIKEDGSPNLRPFQQKEVDDLRESFKKPQLIQGYTAENWQEIIDGGYLCEFSDDEDFDHIRRDTLRKRGNAKLISEQAWFDSGNEKTFYFCRPAQIKGVMRPIFVEPVDKSGLFHFFDEKGGFIGHRIGWDGITYEATKYIEL